MKVPNISTTSINLLNFFRKCIKATVGSNPILRHFYGDISTNNMGLNSDVTKADENIGDKQHNKYFKIR